MPFNFNGIGTTYYGQRDLLEDGSFVTTEWLILIYVPIIPLGSFRIVPSGKSSNLLVYRSNQYLVKQVPMNWRQVRNTYSLYILLPLAILSTIFGVIELLERTNSNTTPQVVKTPQKTLPLARPSYVRPIVADNGVPFPSVSNYIDGYPQEFTDGLSSVTIDNSKNDSDVFVKLFSVESNLQRPVRVFFVRANDLFSAKNLRAGNFEVRYRDLNSGALSRTDTFNLEEVQTDKGIQFSRLTLTLYKVANGNMKIRTISEKDF